MERSGRGAVIRLLFGRRGPWHWRKLMACVAQAAEVGRLWSPVQQMSLAVVDVKRSETASPWTGRQLVAAGGGAKGPDGNAKPLKMSGGGLHLRTMSRRQFASNQRIGPPSIANACRVSRLKTEVSEGRARDSAEDCA